MRHKNHGEHERYDNGGGIALFDSL